MLTGVQRSVLLGHPCPPGWPERKYSKNSRWKGKSVHRFMGACPKVLFFFQDFHQFPSAGLLCVLSDLSLPNL